MKWKVILRKLHPENLVDCLVDTIIWMMEAWAIIRAIIIMMLVVIVLSINIQKLLPDYDTIQKWIGEEHEKVCAITGFRYGDQSSW